MLQFESLLFKGRPFPKFNPVTEVAFLLEMVTHVLAGTHDIMNISGPVELYISNCKEDFPGMSGTMLHTYSGDFCGRDCDGIIFSLIAGADARTCAKEDSTYVAYPIFGTPGLSIDIIQDAMNVLTRYIRVLSPEAEIICNIL